MAIFNNSRMGTSIVKKLFPVYNLYSISIIRFTDDADMLSWAVLINVSFHPLRYHWSFRRNTFVQRLFSRHIETVSKYIFLLVCVCLLLIHQHQTMISWFWKNLPLIFKNNRIQETSLLFYLFICDCEINKQIKCFQWS